MLTMRELSRVYRTETVETTALDRIDLDIADGEFVAIMGPSGCGKSTLLNVIGMLDSPTSGSYVFDGREVAGLPEGKLADVRKKNIGFIFQSFNLASSSASPSPEPSSATPSSSSPTSLPAISTPSMARK
jgi:putative ABC transport system ATP-binding protein